MLIFFTTRLKISVSLALLCVLCVGAGYAQAQEAILVKDINQHRRALISDSACSLGSTQLLVIDDGLRGRELWVGDGFAGSTHLVKDIYPGPTASLYSSSCVVLNSVAYFTANDGVHGAELWRTDGTEAGTYMVADIEPGSEGSSPGSIVVVGSALLFSARTTTYGMELWKTDGSEAGTVMVKDLASGNTDSFPGDIVKISDTMVLFGAGTSATGRELYRTDGTQAGTVLVADIVPGGSSSNPSDLVNVNGVALFVAGTAAAGRELWRSDGTVAGTSLVKDVKPGVDSGASLMWRKVVNNRLLFVGTTVAEGAEPWVSDGTTAGTTILKDINPGVTGSSLASLTLFKGKVFFVAKSAASGDELWSTDGTPGGTLQQSEIGPGSTDGVSPYSPMTATLDGKKLLFAASPLFGSSGKLFATEGIPYSYEELLDPVPGAGGAYVWLGDLQTSSGIVVGGPVPIESLSPTTMFISDGSPSGTKIHPGTMLGYNSSSTPIILGTLAGKVIFAADDADHGYELWSSDGTEAGTQLIKDINQGLAWSVLPQLGGAVFDGRLFFVGTSTEFGAEPWVTDGTAAGTMMFKDIESGAGSSFYGFGSARRRFYVLPLGGSGRLIFPAATSTYGTELWVSDGTSSGTTLLKDIFPGTDGGIGEDSFEAAMGTNGAKLFFAAADGTSGTELWATDGTLVGTQRVSDIAAGAESSSPVAITTVPIPGTALVVFSAQTSAHGRELWYYNGTSSIEIRDINPGASGSYPSSLAFITSPAVLVFFAADDGSHGKELWLSTGSGAGTAILKDIVPGVGGSYPDSITAVNQGTVMFKACSQTSAEDCEPWKSDATLSGTVRLKDLATTSAQASSRPRNFTPLGATGQIYFMADVSTTSYTPTIFRTDLSEAGTVALALQGSDAFSDTAVSNYFYPYQPMGGDLTFLFQYTSSAYGLELFKLGADQCPADNAKINPGLCGCGVADDDSDGDGVVDCFGSIRSLTPTRPKFTVKKNKVTIVLRARSDAQYVLQTRTYRKGSKPGKFRSRTLSKPSYKITKPKNGYVLEAKYRYQLKSESALKSKISKVAKKKF